MGNRARRRNARELFRTVIIAIALMGAVEAFLSGQTGVRVPPIPSLISIPVPYDPSELVTGDAQVIRNAEERAATLQLLVTAQRLSNVRLRPYDLKTTFTSYGSLPSDGRWILEDTSPGAGIYRWTAQGPSFSGIFLSLNKLLSSNQPGGAVPLRLAQVRSAIFGVYYPQIGPYAALRMANGYLNGGELRCVLVARGGPRTAQPEFAKGRSFGESEYCVDPRTGLLAMYSPVAGVYIHYDYASAEHFHDITIPDRFTIAERGRTIIEARTENLSDAQPKNSNLFLPAGLSPVGAGEVMEVPTLVTENGLPGESTNVEVVVVHGVVSPDGKLNEAEVLTSTNPTLDESALEHAAKTPMLRMDASTQSGAAPHPREIVFTEEFVPRRPLPNPFGAGPTDSTRLAFPPPPPPLNAPTRIKVGEQVQAAKILAQPQPVYPPLAQQASIQGSVILHAIIDKDGRPAALQVISGHPLLVQAALDAVKAWRYQQTQLNGEPVEVDTTITVTFLLGG